MKIYITPEKILEVTFKDDVPQIPKIVYIFFYKSLIKKIEGHFNLEKVRFTRGDFYVEKNRDFGIITNFGAGESGALMLAEELSAVGVERIVAIGAVGSLSDDLKIGDVVIIEKASSQSDVGKVYDHVENEVFTSKEQNKKIKEIFEQNKIKSSSVKTLSVPTIYRETEEEIEKAKENNISVIEMEAFSLALVFSLRNVQFSSVGCVSDVLGDKKWGFENDFKTVFDVLKTTFLKIQKGFEDINDSK